jgi:glutamate-1-semialdehyde 2,1-aminomutase
MTEKSKILFEEAQRFIPGGVNSPVRAFKDVNLSPLFIREARGSKIYDVDGKEYIDYVLSWGPMILGHCHPEVINAIQRAAERGTSYGAPTRLEIDMAHELAAAFPSIELVRMVNSGTEAVMSAIRLARGYTGREKIIKFEGCYHGHADSMLAKAGSGVATMGIAGSPGVPAKLAELTITLPFNNIAAVESAVDMHGADLAGIIVEPVAGNMGVVPPKSGFLEFLRQITHEHGIILVFDEVITGFRLAYGGVQTMMNIKPDLTCLGKIIGGGLPVGAFGGRKEIMEKLAPLGPVYQAGTLSGNPIAMSAGLETLKILRKHVGRYESLGQKTEALCEKMKNIFSQQKVPVCINRVGSMFTIFFTSDEVFDFHSASKSNTSQFRRFFKGMLDNGINLAPSQFEAAFVSFAHTDEDMEKTIEACASIVKSFS